MSTKQKHTLNTPDSAENNHRLPFGDKLRTQENMDKHEPELNTAEQLENSPLVIRCINNEWLITMADQALTNRHKSREDALLQLENEKWNVIAAVCTTIFRILFKEEKEGRPVTEALQKTATQTNTEA